MSKRMSNVYLKVTVENKKVSRSVFGGAPTHTIGFSNFLLQLKNQRSGGKTVCGFSTHYFDFERNFDIGTIKK